MNRDDSGNTTAMTASPDVSVVIPTRDSAVHLRRCLASLSEDTGSSFEVLVVDQRSADGTRDTAVAFAATLLEVPRPDVYGAATAHSRNVGAAAAQGEYILHLDADMTLAPKVLAASLVVCREEGHVALTLEEVDVTDGFWAECKALERRTYRGSSILEAARFVRADVFHDVGGYDEGLGSGEDWDIHVRYVGEGSIGRLPSAIYHHLGKLTLSAHLRKKFRYGRSARFFLGKHQRSAFSREMASAYRRSWRIFAGEPLHAVGFVFLRFAEAAALGAGMAVAALERRLSDARAGVLP
jgi:glycosyltransferase involved in cell wall biosynthesis